MSDNTASLKQELTQIQKRAQEIRSLLKSESKREPGAAKAPRGRSSDSLPTFIIATLRERGPMKAGDLLDVVVPARGVKITSARTLIASMCSTKELMRTGSRGEYMYSAA